MISKKILSLIIITISAIIAAAILMILHNYSIVQHFSPIWTVEQYPYWTQDSILLYILLFMIFIVQSIYIAYSYYKINSSLFLFWQTSVNIASIALLMLNNLFFTDWIYVQFPILSLILLSWYFLVKTKVKNRLNKAFKRLSLSLIIFLLVCIVWIFTNNLFGGTEQSIRNITYWIFIFKGIVLVISLTILLVLSIWNLFVFLRSLNKWTQKDISTVVFCLRCFFLWTIWILFEWISPKLAFVSRSIFYLSIAIGIIYFVINKRQKKEKTRIYVWVIWLFLLLLPHVFTNENISRNPIHKYNISESTNPKNRNDILDTCNLPRRSNWTRKWITIQNRLTPCTQRFRHYYYDKDIFRMFPFFMFLFLVTFYLYVRIVFFRWISKNNE